MADQQGRRNVPAVLLALGREPMPPTISADGKTYRLRQVFKHDFFAATAMYEGDTGKVVLKINRRARFFGFPLRWVGRWLANREAGALGKLHRVDGVPRLVDHYERTGLVREYIAGHALRKGEHVADDFHARLREIVGEVHRRGMAYVDLEKCENVLVGDDGRPYLIDFQIAWHWPRRWGGELWPITSLRRFFQHGDLYHLRKLQRRTRPDQLSAEELADSYRRPWYVRLHRALTWPFTWLRRTILERVDPRRGPGERGRVSDNETVRTI
ncbi:MAG: hypothetical protein J5J06_14190 [Phycisphaerae bacterium]|nr:hypothetical protein [Phycisphaerae bacterium]